MWHAANMALLCIELESMSKTLSLNTLRHGIIIGGIVTVDCNDLESHQKGTLFINAENYALVLEDHTVP